MPSCGKKGLMMIQVIHNTYDIDHVHSNILKFQIVEDLVTYVIELKFETCFQRQREPHFMHGKFHLHTFRKCFSHFHFT